MTAPSDAYWDELGIAWRAIKPEINVLMPRLQARLHRQSLFITLGLFAGLPLSGAGFFLGLYTIWSGWTSGTWNFVIRGIAIGVISIILGVATSLLVPVRANKATRAFSEMIDLSIARSQRIFLTVRLAFYACIVAAVLGLMGSVVRAQLTRPPQLSPIVDIVVLALCALGLDLYGRQIKVGLEKMRYLKRTLVLDDDK
jgi:hypothetical protein